MASVTPERTRASIAYVTIGRSYTGSRCLLVMRVSGSSRLPVPPARITPFTVLSSTGHDGGGALRLPEALRNAKRYPTDAAPRRLGTAITTRWALACTRFGVFPSIASERRERGRSRRREADSTRRREVRDSRVGNHMGRFSPRRHPL